MKSRVARALVLFLGLAAMGAAGYKVWDLEQEMTSGHASAAAFDGPARQIVAGLAELGAAEQAYVAVGQGEDYWFQKFTSTLQTVNTRLAALRQVTQTPEAGGALESVVEQLASFSQLDQRARDLIKSGQRLSGSDLIFTDCAQAINRITSLVSDAQAKEIAARASGQAARKLLQAYVAGGGAIVALLAMILLLPIPRSASRDVDAADAAEEGPGLGLSRGAAESSEKAAEAPDSFTDLALHAASPSAAPDLAGAARVCAALACVREMSELPALLEQAAGLLDASGLIVWVADAPGGDLHPAVSHGYTAPMIGRLGIIKAGADNATAIAYRTGTIQAVAGDPLTNGALVVPLSTSVGVAGALAAELRHGRETDQTTRSLAAIVAAQLATLFTPAAEAHS